MSQENSQGQAVYVDDRELAKRTSIARITWQTMRARGQGPAYFKLGRRVLYRWTEVEEWIESRRVENLGGAS